MIWDEYWGGSSSEMGVPLDGLDTELDDDWGVPHDSGNIHISRL